MKITMPFSERSALVALFVAMLHVQTAQADEPLRPPKLVIEPTLALGGGNPARDSEVFFGLGLRASVRDDSFVVSAGFNTATLLIGSGHSFLTIGAGVPIPLSRGRVLVEALAGRHNLNADTLFGEEVHHLRVAGVRAALEGDIRVGPLATMAISAVVFGDLDRAWDAYTSRTVGGWTFLFAFGLGFGG